MIVHNLTDHSIPYRQPRRPKVLKVAGRSIDPGKSADIPDHLLKVSDIAGWITSMAVSIDGLPEWYQAVRRANQGKALENPDSGKSSNIAEVEDDSE